MIRRAWLAMLLILSSSTGIRADSMEIEQAKAHVIRAAVEKVAPCIVTIETVGGAQPVTQGPHGRSAPSQFRLGDGPTTGLVLSRDGLIITSSINFARNPSVITVTLANERRLVAKLLSRDLIRRLALLKVDAGDLPTPEWSTSQDIQIGQYAIACGRGLSSPTPFISLGIVSALGRRNGNAIQTDAKISPINYGGPLIDIEGRVMGILVPMAGSGEDLAGTEWYDSGIGFAIYKSKIDFVIERMARGETIEAGKMGVVLEPDEPDGLPFLDKLIPVTPGARIRAIAENSPADKAGLQPGDKITALDGSPTGDVPELLRRLSDRAAGETIKITVRRRWQTLQKEVRLLKADEIQRLSRSSPPVSP